MNSKNIKTIITLIIFIKYASGLQKYGKVSYQKQNVEFGSYMNPNPREPCEGEELQRLNTCANDVLARLDDCKADDLACECCALQSLDKHCYGLCPKSPSGGFLSVLYEDCKSLNDVNACGLPFKKTDGNKGPADKGPNGLKKYATRKNTLLNKDPETIVKSHLGGSKDQSKGITNTTIIINQTSPVKDEDYKYENKSTETYGLEELKTKLQSKLKSEGSKQTANMLFAMSIFCLAFLFF